MTLGDDMNIKFNSQSTIRTKYCNLNLMEDHEQKCVHIWISNPDYAEIEIDGNHILIKPPNSCSNLTCGTSPQAG